MQLNFDKTHLVCYYINIGGDNCIPALSITMHYMFLYIP